MSEKLKRHTIHSHNEKAWDKAVELSNIWTVGVSAAEIVAARSGEPTIKLTPTRGMPPTWLNGVRGKRVLGLAAGGGQQGPLLAAMGAKVSIQDLSAKQLEQDRAVAEREGLDIELCQGPADQLSGWSENTFDWIINPCSTCFFPDLFAVWRECQRVLKPGGHLFTGFIQPIAYGFDFEKANCGQYELRYPRPYSDADSLSEGERQRFIREETPLEFGHSLSDHIAGLIDLNFIIDGFYEDDYGGQDPIDRFLASFIGLRARLSKP